MPRNPNKRMCSISRCKAWAMRGHHLCRSHRDKELGSRGAGAPEGNLNAYKTGQFATLPTVPILNKIALGIARDPEHLPEQIAQLTFDLHGRSKDPVKTLTVLQRVIPYIIPHLHESIFLVELENALPNLPDHFRPRFLNALYRNALPLSPEDRVKFFRELMERMSKIQIPEE